MYAVRMDRILGSDYSFEDSTAELIARDSCRSQFEKRTKTVKALSIHHGKGDKKCFSFGRTPNRARYCYENRKNHSVQEVRSRLYCDETDHIARDSKCKEAGNKINGGSRAAMTNSDYTRDGSDNKLIDTNSNLGSDCTRGVIKNRSSLTTFTDVEGFILFGNNDDIKSSSSGSVKVATMVNL